MNKRLMLVLLFGFLFAGGASLVLYRVMVSRVGMAPAAASVQSIFVATHDIDAGKLLRDEDMELKPWSGPIPSSVIRARQDASGRAVTSKIYRNEPVLSDRLAAVGVGAGLSAMIPAGMRAVAVKVNDVVGVAGFVVPGTHVDVIASGTQLNVSTASAGSVSRMILQDITVLSAGQDFKQDSDGKPVSATVVNLLVTPQQAEILSLAGNQTTIQLILRNGQDKDKVQTAGTSLTNLLASAGPAPAVVEAPVIRPQRAVARAEAVPPPVTVVAPPATAPLKVAGEPKIEIFNGTKMTEVAVTPGTKKEARP